MDKYCEALSEFSQNRLKIMKRLRYSGGYLPEMSGEKTHVYLKALVLHPAPVLAH